MQLAGRHHVPTWEFKSLTPWWGIKPRTNWLTVLQFYHWVTELHYIHTQLHVCQRLFERSNKPFYSTNKFTLDKMWLSHGHLSIFVFSSFCQSKKLIYPPLYFNVIRLTRQGIVVIVNILCNNFRNMPVNMYYYTLHFTQNSKFVDGRGGKMLTSRNWNSIAM